MEDLTTGNPAETMAGNPSSEPASSTEGTGTTNGEARQSATAQDSFIPQGVDLSTLPPNLRQHVEKINADMVRGFTEKTTKLSETIKSESAKAAEAFKQKAELYDQIATQEEFVKMWNEHVQKAQATATGQDPNDPVAQMKAQLQEMQQKMQLSETAQITDAFAEAVNEKGEKLHPEFDRLNAIMLGKFQDGQTVEDFSLLRACIELSQGRNPQEKLANGYKSAKANYDAIFEEGKKAGMGRQQAKALNGSLPPSNSIGETLTVTEKKPRNAHEALAMAKKGVMVSRD